MSATIKASTSVPFLSRFILTTIEPVAAVIGAIMNLRDPGNFISTYLMRGTTGGNLEAHALCYQLAGLWVGCALNAAITMRAYDDLRLWRLLMTGMLFSDAALFYSLAQAVGGFASLFDVGEWSAAEAGATTISLVFLLTRLSVVLGLGVKTGVKTE